MCRTRVLASSSTVTAIGPLAACAVSTGIGRGQANHVTTTAAAAIAPTHPTRFNQFRCMVLFPSFEDCHKVERVDAAPDDKRRDQRRHKNDRARQHVGEVLDDEGYAHELPGKLLVHEP